MQTKAKLYLSLRKNPTSTLSCDRIKKFFVDTFKNINSYLTDIEYKNITLVYN